MNQLVGRSRLALVCFISGFAMGLATLGAAQVFATVNTNGTLKGYIVQKNGKEVCRDPAVWNQFRGSESYIICD